MPSFSSVSLQRWLLPPVAAALALALQMGGDNALAQQTPAPQAGPGARPETLNLTPAQRQELFNGRKSMALGTTSARIALLQQTERCLNGARDLDALRQCQVQERTAQRELMERKRTEVASLYQRLGLPAPQPRGEWGRKGLRPDGASGPANSGGKPSW
ncbi:MAG: hypothetical protein WCK64_11405 [Synechococcaceae cyanobacterium ELA445]